MTTPVGAPWHWKIQGGRWHLIYARRDGPVALTGGVKGLLVRSHNHRLVPITPEHPVAQLIAAAPELLAVCQEIAGELADNTRIDLAETLRVRLYDAITSAGVPLASLASPAPKEEPKP